VREDKDVLNIWWCRNTEPKALNAVMVRNPAPDRAIHKEKPTSSLRLSSSLTIH
jgi:hypothetical protein